MFSGDIYGFGFFRFVWDFVFDSVAPNLMSLTGILYGFDCFLLVLNQIGCNKRFGDEYHFLISIGKLSGKWWWPEKKTSDLEFEAYGSDTMKRLNAEK